ncbi:BREX-4 system phosphatase PglZ [Caproiciproducens galactitolivorans]|uniref:BREX-4 system phosphatase PglZ n=1 Tax=Caproiciproducens galactitolivorans TaxID=642589 RepID=A0ABT4BYA4_9FIRM|nr:BREX-4 system phosphatase PglZ [Caproiciproducens galactitolivorans]MCY1714911.1 BREX-4 system phosphatase PglZ [Caproiciproducens galactitolivorans]
MECKDILSCFEEINAYCSGEPTGYVLIVNTENYTSFHDILIRLQTDATKDCVLVSEHCLENCLPNNIDDIIEIIKQDGQYVLAGLSQAVMLEGANALSALVKKLLELPIRGHAVVLLEHAQSYLRQAVAADLRENRKMVLVSADTSPLPRILLVKKASDCIGYKPKGSIKKLLSYLETLTDDTLARHPEISVVTSFGKTIFGNAVYSVNEYGGVYLSLVKAYPEIASGTMEAYGTEEQWRNLAASMERDRSFSSVLDAAFGKSDQLTNKLPYEYQMGDSYRLWLLWLGLKIFSVKDNRYLALAVSHSESSGELESHIYMDLLDVDLSNPDFSLYFAERKLLIDAMPENLICTDRYCSLVGKYEKNAVYYLADLTEKEEQEFLRCFSTYSYTEDEIRKAVAAFPSLSLYLKPFAFSEANLKLPEKDSALRAVFTDYFANYKLQKILNRVFPEHLSKVIEFSEEQPYTKLLPRSSFISKMPRKNTQLYFLDALGVEFLAFIQAKCEEYGMVAEIAVGRCEIPSITVNNKEFYQTFPNDIYKVDDLDELKHHSQVIDYQKCKEPVHLFRELEIIDSTLRHIQSGLVQNHYERAVIVSDHGASRLAVIYEHEDNSPIKLDEKAEHSGRCCPCEENPQIPYAAYENGFAVLANYERFKGGRKANVEVHGGATLEEVMVPVITLTKKPDSIEFCFVPPVIELKGKEVATLTLFSNIPLRHPRLFVNSIPHDGVFVEDKKHISFSLPELKRSKRDCFADVYDGDKKMVTDLPFSVQRNVGKDNINL